MTGKERILAALRGETPDTTPIMLHNFMMAIPEFGTTHADYRQSPQLIADVHIKAVETYQYDGITVDIDTVTLAGACGVPVDFPENEPARSHEGLLNDLEDVGHLPAVNLENDARVMTWVEATQKLVDLIGADIFVRGNGDQCPFSLASMLRTPQELLMDLMDEENAPALTQLLTYCTDICIQFTRLLAQTGCAMTSNGDSPAGPAMISPAMYRQWALPYEKQVAEAAHQAGTAYLLHICGNTDAILEDMVTCGADCIELDYLTDIHKIHDICKDKLVFAGNIDPSGVLAYGAPALVEHKTRELLELYQDSPRFILNAGCAIPPGTPAENLHTMIRTARQFH